MKEPRTILESQVENLIAELRRYESDQIDRILHRAYERAADIRKRARRRARETVGGAVREARRRREHEAQRLAARVANEARQRRQARDRERLREGWNRLPQALEARWGDAEARIEWCRMALAEAALLLAESEWTIEHAAGLTDADREALARDFGGDRTLRWQASGTLTSGLRIGTPRATLDASGEALLADEQAIAAELLAEMERETEEIGS